MAEEMVDVRELHRRYGPPTSWWYSRAEAGEIPSFKLGKYRRFKISDIERWLEAQRQGPTEVRSTSAR
jgi:predicted DNA-binding transcriptional regulator AlpA